jgi:hypothetical protein
MEANMSSQLLSAYLLHGKGGRPTGTVLQLEECLKPLLPHLVFHRPALLHSDPNVLAERSFADLQTKDITPNSIVVGISLGGLLAAKLQEFGREDLTVICISSPTWADDVKLERRMQRVAFYSSSDAVIAGRTVQWRELADAYDIPWLSHNTDAHKVSLALLIAAWLAVIRLLYSDVA